QDHKLLNCAREAERRDPECRFDATHTERRIRRNHSAAIGDTKLGGQIPPATPATARRDRSPPQQGLAHRVAEPRDNTCVLDLNITTRAGAVKK
ncbi:hypothetical protein ABZ567_32305, partial [Streptomyces sp. NPDC016459]|uniref:hypothetical protein n=1 Tax=Streptomyces sp. NPDC016459 TaxID=3157190 RepID=UPI0033F94724